MITQVFSVFDTRAGVYMNPMYFANKGYAIRSFEDAVNEHTHQFHRHAADYTLVHLGQYDDLTGKFELLEFPVVLINGLECEKKEG